MERYAWKATVLPGKLPEYIRRHNEIWPEMKDVLHQAGIRNYTIWNVGNELFGYYECDSIAEAARVSQSTGARADYVQGGGGNTSVKLPGGLMAIKASGFCLSDIHPDKAYAVLDGADLRNFYLTTDPSALADVEKEGSARAKADVRHIDGLADLRPSVEAGFHSILKTFVVHTHSVYANLAACSTACRPIAAQAFAGANYTWGWVPYTDPGANLTFAIRDELRRVEKETGKVPSVILMQNHGIIVHDDDPHRCKRTAGPHVRLDRHVVPQDRRA